MIKPALPSSKGERGNTLETLVELPTYFLPRLSWRRDRVAFYWDRTGRLELYVASLSDLVPHQISHGEVPRTLRTGFVWDRTDASIVFGKDTDGNEQHDLYRIDVNSGVVERLTDDPKSEKHPLEFSPDNQWLLVGGNQLGHAGHRQMNLWRLNLNDRSMEQLTDYVNPVAFWFQSSHWSPKGDRIAFSANESTDLRNSDIYLASADGSNPRRAFRVREGSREYPADWSPDGRRLSLSSDSSGEMHPGVLDLDTGSIRWLGEKGRDEYALSFSPDGRFLLTVPARGVEAQPIVYDLSSGEVIRLGAPQGVSLGGEFSADGSSVVLLNETPTRRPELLERPLRGGGSKTLLAAEYGQVDQSLLVEPEVVSYPSFDGRSIEALLYTPPGVFKGSRLPLVVEIHGGPTAQFFRDWDPFAQFLVGRGFVLLRPNIRGSTGYGVEFRDSNRYDWGGGDLEDVVRGVEFAKRLPNVDPQRIGIWGGSYGGFMTFIAAVKRPEIWKAACAWVGITDLARLYAGYPEHFQYFLREQMGEPGERAELWKDRSALYFADNLTAKLLMIHGSSDPRCPVEQSRIFRDRLLELGRKEGADFEYVEFADEGHGSTDIAQKLRSVRLVADFFEHDL